MDLAQEVGYLKGMQDATQRELGHLNASVETLKSTTATKADVAELRSELANKIDEAVAKLQGTSGQQQKLVPESWLTAILKSHLTPMVITVLAMMLVMVVVFSRETGRAANTFVPYPSAQVPPGGTATSTTTVTSPGNPP